MLYHRIVFAIAKFIIVGYCAVIALTFLIALVDVSTGSLLGYPWYSLIVLPLMFLVGLGMRWFGGRLFELVAADNDPKKPPYIREKREM